MYPKKYLRRRARGPIKSEVVPIDITILRSILAMPNCVVRIKEDQTNVLAIADLYFHIGVVLVLVAAPFVPSKHTSKRLGNWWFDLKELENTLAKLYAITAEYLKGKEFDTVGAIAVCNKAQVYLSQLLKVLNMTAAEMMSISQSMEVSSGTLKVVKSIKPVYEKRGRPTRDEMLAKLAIPLEEELPKPKYKKNRKPSNLGCRGKPLTRKYLRMRKKKAIQRRLERERLKKEKEAKETQSHNG